MTLGQAHLRRLVLALNQVPVLGRLTRIPYHVAAYAVAALARLTPEVSALYVKGTFARNCWTPGTSDIDLTLVLREGLSPEAEFAAASRFLQKFQSLTWLFPMLGEVQILRETYLRSAQRFGLDGYEMRFWRPLAGGVPTGFEPWQPERLHAERLRYALRFYRHHFPHRSRSRLTGAVTTCQRLHRKIRRVLEAPPVSAVPDAIALMAQTLALIDSTPWAPGPSDPPHDLMVQKDLSPPDRRTLPASLEPVRHHLHGIVGIDWDSRNPYVVAHSGLPAAVLGQIMSAAALAFDEPIVLTRSTFESFLHLADPLLFFGLWRARILWGEGDPLTEIAAPGRETTRLAVCRSISDFYLFPFDPALATMTEERFRSLLVGWVLRGLRFLEDGYVDLDYHTAEAYFARTGRDIRYLPETWEPRFVLCRRFADDLQRCLPDHSM